MAHTGMQGLQGRSQMVCQAKLGWPNKPSSNTSTAATARKASGTTLAPPSTTEPVVGKQEEASRGVFVAIPSFPSSLPSQMQQVSDFASQLVTSFSWPNLYPQSEQAQVEQALSDAARANDALQQTPDISPCLSTSVGVWEMKHIRKLAHLTALTYKLASVTPRAMRRKHALDLVTTSWACEIRSYEHSKTAEEVLEEGDGMGVSVFDAKSTYNGVAGRNAPPSSPAPDVVMSNIIAVPPTLSISSNTVTSQGSNSQPQPSNSNPPQQPQQQQQRPNRRWTSPAEMVAGMVSDAAAAASAAAVSAVSVTPLASAAGSLYAGLASLPIASALGSGPRSSAPAAAAALMSAAAAAVHSKKNANGKASAESAARGRAQQQRDEAARLAAAAGPAAIAAAPGSATRLAAPVQSTTGSPACPSEWFVCDDTATCTRYFVIQGSDTIDHWKLNLTFDPVTFEDPELGIKVHRGAYEAAQILYERFLPMVYEHLDASPFAKICFTGHSIGGSLGTLLAIMYNHRGVLPAANIANVYTFGSPAVFCMDPDAPVAAAARARHQRLHHNHHHYNQTGSNNSESQRRPNGSSATNGSSNGTSTATAALGLAPVRPCSCGTPGSSPLAAVGLPEHIVRNVIMARDIVPRSFICDYSLVADILKGWGPSFKSHPGLAHAEHKHLYFFTGRIMVLQPDSWHWFNSDPDHPLLPPGPDLYLLTSPPPTPTAPATQPPNTTETTGQHAAHQAANGNGDGLHAWNGHGVHAVANGNGTGWHAAANVNSAQSATNGSGTYPGHGNGVHAPTESNGNGAHAAVNGSAATNGVVPTISSKPILVAAVPGKPSPVAARNGKSTPVEVRNGKNSPVAARNGKGSPVASGNRKASPSLSVAAQAQVAAGIETLKPVVRAPVRDAVEALYAIMDNPHPLDTLADPGAYMEKGSISRYHNPENYTAALGRLIYLKRVQEGRIPNWVNHAYSRSLVLEAREDGQGSEASLAPWDSSDADMGSGAMATWDPESLSRMQDVTVSDIVRERDNSPAGMREPPPAAEV